MMERAGENRAPSLEPPKHTPYGGGQSPFRIGLFPLELHDWIEVDDRLEFYLEEKDHYLDNQFGKVFVAEDGTRDAQQEVLEMLLEHLLQRFPETYRLDDGKVQIGNGGREVPLVEDDPSPLLTASKLVQEDLVLMRQHDEGWRLVAACVCFPSSWALVEKFSKPLHEIHKPVPGFGPGSRNAGMINRIFDNLKEDQPVRRLNWAIYSNDALYQADRAHELLRREKSGLRGLEVFLRVEHQTLRKLEISGDILFTIRIHVDPLVALEKHPNRRELCEQFVSALKGLNAEQVNYKGMEKTRDVLVDKLTRLGSGEYAG